MNISCGFLVGALACFAAPCIAQKSVTQADIDALPPAITLSDVLRRWGNPNPVAPFVAFYPSDFLDFEYWMVFDGKPWLDEAARDDSVPVVVIYRREPGLSEYNRTVWVSDIYYPQNGTTLAELEALPSEASFEILKQKKLFGKIRKVSEAVSLATAQAPVKGYRYEFYFLPMPEKANSLVLASVYVVSDVARKLCWGRIINPTTGELLPEYLATEPVQKREIRRGFLYPER